MNPHPPPHYGFPYNEQFSLLDPFSISINRLPPELKRLIFSFIDIETRLKMLFEKRTSLLTGTPRVNAEAIPNSTFDNHFNNLDMDEKKKIYDNAFVHKLYSVTKRRYTPPVVTTRNSFRKLIPFGDRMLICSAGEAEHVINNHLNEDPTPHSASHYVYTLFRKFANRFNKHTNIRHDHIDGVLLSALRLLTTTTTYIPKFDYYIRKMAFQFICTTAIKFYLKFTMQFKVPRTF